MPAYLIRVQIRLARAGTGFRCTLRGGAEEAGRSSARTTVKGPGSCHRALGTEGKRVAKSTMATGAAWGVGLMQHGLWALESVPRPGPAVVLAASTRAVGETERRPVPRHIHILVPGICDLQCRRALQMWLRKQS